MTSSSPGMRPGGLFKPPVPTDPSQFGGPPQQPGVTRVFPQSPSQLGNSSQGGRPPGSLLSAYASQGGVGASNPGNISPPHSGTWEGSPTQTYQSQSGRPPEGDYRSFSGHLQQQQGEFYQDATEAISIAPGAAAQSTPFAHPGYAGADPLRSQGFVPSRPGEMGGTPTPPPQRQQQSGSMVLLIAGICCAVVLLITAGLALLFFARGNTNQQASVTPTVAPTTAPTPTPSPTQEPTATPIPSPTAVPTPPPDQGFTWCGQSCLNYGFQTEYVASWQLGVPGSASGVQFTNPSQIDEYAGFKALGPTASTATDVVMADIQSNYASRPGYTPPTGTSSTTIAGETWIYAITYYQGDTQRERVVVYATVHQGKAYVIELQAPDALFDQVNAQAFINMLGKFQFTAQ